MGRLWLFLFLTWITRNQLLSLVVVLLLSAGSYGYLTGRLFGVGPLLRDWRTMRALNRTVATNPHDLTARSELGRLLVWRRRDEEAIGMLTPVVERHPDLVGARADLGLAFLRTGQVAEGKRDLAEALALDPKLRYGEPLLHWADATLHRGELAKGIRLLEEHRELYGSSVEGLYKLGRADLGSGDRRKAREAPQAALLAYRTSPRFKRRMDRGWWLATHLLRWRAG
ncbi:MAG: hypothetical protein ACE5JN_02255 [Candidatus Methylomirabilia bacterium]